MSDVRGIERLLEIMRRLRDDEHGCPWDLAQSFQTIAPYTLEEAYEVVDAIDRKDPLAMRTELGDLLFQVVFHARLAEEQGLFNFDDVVTAISDKLTDRHPHIFAGARFASAAEQNKDWESRKTVERAARGLGTLEDVPLALPALKRAEKLGKRASSVGFDWQGLQGPRAALDSELRELDEAICSGAPRDRIFDELGDVLFSSVNVARHLGLDAEEALRASSVKFARRFAWVELEVEKSGRKLRDVSAPEINDLWRAAKTRDK